MSADADFSGPVLHTRLASALRNAIHARAKLPDFRSRQLPGLIANLRAASWSDFEIEKVLAYTDFFSGADASGYDRVMRLSLARRDYVLFMTACTYCYLADRFAEGVALLEDFQPKEDVATNWGEYWAHAGYIYLVAGYPIEKVLVCFDEALKHPRSNPMAAVNAYSLYFEAGRLEQCRQIRELIQDKHSTDPEAQFAMAYVELARGYYAEGFRLMEARYSMPEKARTLNATLLPRSRWSGQYVVGRRLLIHGEQGLGDMIMMARYIPILHGQGIELLMDGRAEVQSLMSQNFPYCDFIVGDLSQPIHEPFDYWIGLMSLPHVFKTTALNVPAIGGYLSAPEDQRAYWRERIGSVNATPRLRVGLAWSGNPGHRADKRRSIPFVLICPLLRSHPDIHFFSLQTQVPENSPTSLINVADELVTVADTAAVIAEMDLIISVDTSAIHLAGALGCPAWLLLPHRYEWRWGLEGELNAWYNSVKVMRQAQAGQWVELLEKVSVDLHSFARKLGG